MPLLEMYVERPFLGRKIAKAKVCNGSDDVIGFPLLNVCNQSAADHPWLNGDRAAETDLPRQHGEK